MSKSLETRSLDRAITVLEVLAKETRCSLHQLHERTALPKSTLRRLLGTLTKRHLVRVGISDGLYRPNIALPWSADRAHAAHAVHVGRVVEIALPHMVELTRRVGWPSDLHVYGAGRMQIVESTYSLSPYRMGKRSEVDVDVNMFAAAAGLAYLSRLDEAEVVALARARPANPLLAFERAGVSEAALLEELAGIRQAGYAFRRPGFNTRAAARPFNGMAAPVADQSGAVGALTLFWPRQYMDTDSFAREHADALRAATAAISADLARLP
ncbi:MAG TPA: helix-turn-helix domain-containing protein [Pseudolabrys sp.]|nr:helix-turn-helix domain-containing protein [Pseudolabrys sp.]